MSFEEFLWALDEEQMADAIRTHAGTLETYAVHQAALSLFHRYQIVGGMPAAVNAYRKTLSIEDARVEQREINETYTADMTDPENGISGVAARKVWRSIPSQLLRSSTKNSSTPRSNAEAVAPSLSSRSTGSKAPVSYRSTT